MSQRGPLAAEQIGPVHTEAHMTEELEQQIKRAAEVLRSFGAKEVFLFGSAATALTDEFSDVDLAVSGLPPEVFFKACARATSAIRGREVDLVDLDQDTPFTRYLREEGELHRLG